MVKISQWGGALLALALAIPALCFGQSERGSITGLIEDTSKAPIPGVAVTVVQVATNATTNVFTSESGTYSAANLPPGGYRLQASIQGFQSATVEGIVVIAGGTARVDV